MKADKNQAGGISDKEMPIHISNISFYDKELKKGVKISRNEKCLATGKKFKQCCGAL